jgi:hypothetical protein
MLKETLQYLVKVNKSKTEQLSIPTSLVKQLQEQLYHIEYQQWLRDIKKIKKV